MSLIGLQTRPKAAGWSRAARFGNAEQSRPRQGHPRRLPAARPRRRGTPR